MCWEHAVTGTLFGLRGQSHGLERVSLGARGVTGFSRGTRYSCGEHSDGPPAERYDAFGIGGFGGCRDE